MSVPGWPGRRAGLATGFCLERESAGLAGGCRGWTLADVGT